MHNFIMFGNLKTEPGTPFLLGAELNQNGCNFAIFSRNATAVSLLLFDHPEDSKPSHILDLNPKINKTGDIWHIFIAGIKEGQCYGYTIDGPYWPDNEGHRFNKNKLLLDPYAKAISGKYNWSKPEAFAYQVGSPLGDLSFSEENNFGVTAKSIVVDGQNFDWEGDTALSTPMKDSIIYEMHTRAFTIGSKNAEHEPGTYLAIIDQIPYLKELGITTVELMPVHHFNHKENFKKNPITNEPLYNFWGYSTLGFFAPDSWYAKDENGLNAVYEFKEMVKALHKAGISVILDVVYNHTGEGNEYGPTICFKGIDNSIYYMTEQGRYYKNYSGCGNTLNCNHPVVKRLILDSLRYWVVDMHVDGFRFDLAAILGRDENGNWVPNYSILNEISNDPILSSAQIIAEGWDAAGLYKVGDFPSGWAEWNGKYRDAIRGFIKGDNNLVGELAQRLSGSADLFSLRDRRPYHSINFITAHDGFTLNDIVSYNTKHNIENGEGNRDGNDNNVSWNCGHEGTTTDENVLDLREQQMRNLFTLLMISQGTPMFLYGDEVKFSKNGNNNTYCHDNKLNWFDWSLYRKNKKFFNFCKNMIEFRKSHPVLRRATFFNGINSDEYCSSDISWHGFEIGKPDWSENSHCLAFMLNGNKAVTDADLNDNNIYVAINAHWENQNFHLPTPAKKKYWHLAVDTSTSTGFKTPGKETRVKTSIITVPARSITILIDK